MTAETGSARPANSAVADLIQNGALAGRWRLDPGASRVEFGVRHFWHTITVRGWFDRLSGEATVGADGTVSGRIVIDAASLNTKNKQRDKHLRSADFFDAENHPQVTLTVSGAAADGDRLNMSGTLEAAGHSEPVTFTADVAEASADAITLRAGLTIDRTRFGMTWSPLGVAAKEATGTVAARFTRAAA
jgi:polyisoprenoid-binding protein YceI